MHINKLPIPHILRFCKKKKLIENEKVKNHYICSDFTGQVKHVIDLVSWCFF